MTPAPGRQKPEDVSFRPASAGDPEPAARKGSELEEAKELWKPRAVAAPAAGEIYRSSGVLWAKAKALLTYFGAGSHGDQAGLKLPV